MSAALTALAVEYGRPHLIPTLARLELHIGPAQRGLSGLGNHNAQTAWGAVETVDVEGYEGAHRLGDAHPDYPRDQITAPHPGFTLEDVRDWHGWPDADRGGLILWWFKADPAHLRQQRLTDV